MNRETSENGSPGGEKGSNMFTTEDIIEHVRALADEYPNMVYQADAAGICSYRPNDSNPMGCIIGAALQWAGVRQADLVEWEGKNADEVILGLGIKSGDDHLAWLHTVQILQDRGKTWSQAVASADTEGPIWA